MTLNQLKYVIEIARTGSINKAASNLFISQPVLSASIKSLETECGKPLFSRSNRGIELTPFGKVFLSYITPIHMQLCQLDDMIFKEQKNPSTILPSLAMDSISSVISVRNSIKNTSPKASNWSPGRPLVSKP